MNAAEFQSRLNHIKAAAEGTTGRKKLTRAEAARHASLVRWKKESPFAANVQERLAQIRAARLAKGKTKGGKGKGKAGPAKDARTPQEKANQNRAAISKETGMSDLEGPLVRIGAGMSSDLEPEAYDKLETMGLIKRTSPGKATLTPAGKKWRRAADKGDAEGARAALAEGQEKAGASAAKDKAKADKQAAREKARTERGKARGERKEKREAKPKEGDDKPDAPNPREADRAQRQKERAEDRAAAQADRAQRNKERAEDRATRAKDRETREKERLADRAERKKERDERAKERSASGKQKQQQAIEAEVARIAAARARKTMDELQPILDELKAIRDEALEIAEGDGGYLLVGTPDGMADDLATRLSAIKAGRRNASGDQARIDEGYELAMQLCDLFEALGATVEEEGDEMEMMEEAAPMKAVDLPPDGLKGIEIYSQDADEIVILPGYSVKAVGDGRTGGYLVRFGGDGDLSHWRDVFDKTTDYGRATKSDVYVHHRMLPGVGKRRLVNQAEIGMDDEGIFIKHLLDLRSAYERKLYGMVEADKLGWSSGTAPHLVERKAIGDGRHQILQWPLGLDASYTPMPAGGIGVEARTGAMKSLMADAGIDLLNAIYDNPEVNDAEEARPDAVKASEDDRSRKLLLLELDLLQLEATIT